MKIKLAVLATLLAGHVVSANATSIDLSIDFNSTVAGLTLSGGAAVGQFGWVPVGGSGNYLVAPVGGVATLDLADNTYNQINFLWGSVDYFNKIDFLLSNNTTFTVTGADLIGFSSVIRTIPYSYNSGSLFVNAIKFTNSGWGGLEVDNLTATAVPEPEAYALMLAGLGLVGFAARRKISA